MKAVTFKDNGDASVLEINEIEKPSINEDEVLIKVAAAGINRPDIIQRSGFYPPPKGASEILGLEVSGKVVEVGKNINKDIIDSEVCALLTGGGYAEYAKCHISTVLPVPKGISLVDACTIPETFFTVWTNLFDQAKLTDIGKFGSARTNVSLYGKEHNEGKFWYELSQKEYLKDGRYDLCPATFRNAPFSLGNYSVKNKAFNKDFISYIFKNIYYMNRFIKKTNIIDRKLRLTLYELNI